MGQGYGRAGLISVPNKKNSNFEKECASKCHMIDIMTETEPII